MASFINQISMNNSIRYWTDNTQTLANFTGEYGFERLLDCAIIDFDYFEWEEENRGDKRWILGTRDWTFIRKHQNALRFQRPKSYNPPPPGMIRVWDINATKWTTIKADDYGRVFVKSIFPITMTHTRLVDDERALQKHFSEAELFNFKEDVFNKAYDFFRKKSPIEREKMKEAIIRVSYLQEYEEAQRKRKKIEIDKLIDEKLEKKKKPEVFKQNPANDLKLVNVNEQDQQQAQSIQNLNIRNAAQTDANATTRNFQQPQQKQENVMENFR